MLFSFLFSFAFAEEPNASERGFEIPSTEAGKAIFKSPGYVNRPLRPTTHPKDPALSTGNLENFQRLFINERNLKIAPNKGTEKPNKMSLPIVNRTTAWVDISISGQKIGRIGPLTTGVIHNVAGGEYDVTYTVEHMQYAFVERVDTQKFSAAVTPGNLSADIANADGYKKPHFDDKAATKGGKLTPYLLPAPPKPELPETVQIEGKQLKTAQAITFDKGNAKISEQGFTVLKDVAETLRRFPELKIEISVSINASRREKTNQRLSDDRAAAIQQYLTETEGIEANVTTKGLGSEKTTDEAKELVEILILEGLEE